MIRKLSPVYQGVSRLDILLGVLCSAGEAVLELLLPKAMSNIVDVRHRRQRRHQRPQLYPGHGPEDGADGPGLSLALGVGAAALAAKAGMGFGANVRAAEYAGRCRGFSFANIEQFSTASLITRLTNDVSSVQMTLMMGMRMLVRAPVMLITASGDGPDASAYS